MPLYPRPENWTSPYEPGHSDPKVCAYIDVLEDFFRALEQGTAHLRLPDPSYVRRTGKPSWTPEELEGLVSALDTSTSRELSWASKNKDMQCNAGPGFSRLELPQRLALAQRLDLVLAEHEARAKAEAAQRVQETLRPPWVRDSC